MAENEATLETVRKRLADVTYSIGAAEKYIKDLKREQYELAQTIRILEQRFK